MHSYVQMQFAEALINWFLEYGRDLPWRRNRSVYKTVVSEFMLQQTQAATVVPYFERWMEDFPDFFALAHAQEHEVCKAWEGLGYYRRARYLHRLAQVYVVASPKPATYQEWLNYPGIGPYTAAAISSIAQQERAAVVDGNVLRVLSRLFVDATEYDSTAQATKAYDPLARDLLSSSEPGLYNEALMELGATVCKLKKPQCLICPVASMCSAKTKGNPEAFPRIKKKKMQQRERHLVWCAGSEHILLCRYPENARQLPGIWELPECDPHRQVFPDQSPVEKRIRGIGNQRITEYLYPCKATHIKKLSFRYPNHVEWVSSQELQQLQLSGPHRKWISTLLSKTP